MNIHAMKQNLFDATTAYQSPYSSNYASMTMYEQKKNIGEKKSGTKVTGPFM